MFAAMDPSGAAALICARALDSSLPRPSVAAPVHGGFFHSQSSKSSIHISTSAARVKQRTSSACTAEAAHSSCSFAFPMQKILGDRLRVRARVQPLNFSIGDSMQYQLPLMCVLNAPKRVPDETVKTWESMHDAITWAFDQRDNKTVKTKKWFAEHMGMRVQHVTRMLDRRDLKLDSVQAHVCDCLTGWTACDQYRLLEIERIAQRAAAQLVTAMQMRAA